MHVKQALIEYLVEHDQRCQHTFMEANTMELVLPYLKNISNLWEGVKPEHLSTGYPAMSSYYQSLRGHLRNRARLQETVKDHITFMEETEQDEEVIEQILGKTTPESEKMPPPATPVKATKVQPEEFDKKQPPAKVQKTADQPTIPKKEEEKKEEPKQLQIPLTEAIAFKQWQEYHKLFTDVKTKKRELKALEKRYIEAKSKVYPAKDPSDETD